jgi:hypothetical protein
VKRLARTLAVPIALAIAPASSLAQSVDGYASVLVDTLPNIRRDATAAHAVVELRPRVFAEYRRDLGSRVRFTLAGFAEGLVADRGEHALTRDAIVRPQEVAVEARWQHADVRVGFSRVVWGRLDELLPTDVVNPQDLTRFFLEGRSEGRMPVAMVRTRWIPSDDFSVEAIYVPFFRAGRFDQLDEDTAPFNIRPAFATTRSEPPHAIGNAQGGVRASVTSGRVDWSLSAYRGFEPLPVYEGVVERFPRFTMVGGDFETTRGIWGIRGEIAAFVDRTIQAADAPVGLKARSLEAGIGLDRKAGVYRISGNVIFTKRLPRLSQLNDALFANGQVDRTDLNIVGAVDRSFARETRSIRAFAVYNPGEESGFARVIGTISVRDDVSLEGSAGLFGGRGRDVLARFADRDFLYARLKVFF